MGHENMLLKFFLVVGLVAECGGLSCENYLGPKRSRHVYETHACLDPATPVSRTLPTTTAVAFHNSEVAQNGWLRYAFLQLWYAKKTLNGLRGGGKDDEGVQNVSAAEKAKKRAAERSAKFKEWVASQKQKSASQSQDAAVGVDDPKGDKCQTDESVHLGDMPAPVSSMSMSEIATPSSTAQRQKAAQGVAELADRSKTQAMSFRIYEGRVHPTASVVLIGHQHSNTKDKFRAGDVCLSVGAVNDGIVRTRDDLGFLQVAVLPVRRHIQQEVIAAAELAAEQALGAWEGGTVHDVIPDMFVKLQVMEECMRDIGRVTCIRHQATASRPVATWKATAYLMTDVSASDSVNAPKVKHESAVKEKEEARGVGASEGMHASAASDRSSEGSSKTRGRESRDEYGARYSTLPRYKSMSERLAHEEEVMGIEVVDSKRAMAEQRYGAAYDARINRRDTHASMVVREHVKDDDGMSVWDASKGEGWGSLQARMDAPLRDGDISEDMSVALLGASHMGRRTPSPLRRLLATPKTTRGRPFLSAGTQALTELKRGDTPLQFRVCVSPNMFRVDTPRPSEPRHTSQPLKDADMRPHNSANRRAEMEEWGQGVPVDDGEPERTVQFDMNLVEDEESSTMQRGSHYRSSVGVGERTQVLREDVVRFRDRSPGNDWSADVRARRDAWDAGSRSAGTDVGSPSRSQARDAEHESQSPFPESRKLMDPFEGSNIALSSSDAETPLPPPTPLARQSPPPPPTPMYSTGMSWMNDAAGGATSSMPRFDVPVGGWDSVVDWLQGLGLSTYAGVMLEEGWDSLEVVAAMTEADLQALGVKPGHIRKMMMYRPGRSRHTMDSTN